jgi:hypothetical protein
MRRAENARWCNPRGVEGEGMMFAKYANPTCRTDKLYKQAKALIWQKAVAGLLLGGFLGFLIGVGLGLVQVALVQERSVIGDGQTIFAFGVTGGLILLVLGGVTGYHSGKGRSSG